MSDNNKKFLDENGLEILWSKIKQYFSLIGHKHETSDVNGLDEYLEKNSKAIRDTEKVVDELPDFPLYPSEEQLGKVYLYDGKLYRGKKLPKLILDFKQIEPNEEGEVTKEIFMDFINKNGLNIVMNYGEDGGDFGCNFNFEKNNGGLYIDNGFSFKFEERKQYKEFNYWNNTYVKSLKIVAQSPYNEETEEVWQGCVDYQIDDYWDHEISGSWFLDNSYIPDEESRTFSFGKDESINLVDYIYTSIEEDAMPFNLLEMELELVVCDNYEDYQNGIYHDFLVWEEVSETEFKPDEVTPATADTRERFYRETPTDNIFVTDHNLTGIEIEHDQEGNGSYALDNEEVRKIVDPDNMWIFDYEEGSEMMSGLTVSGQRGVYKDGRYWTSSVGEKEKLSVLRIGSGSDSGRTIVDEFGNYNNCVLNIHTDRKVDFYFVPYFSFNNTNSGKTSDYKYYHTYSISMDVNGVRVADETFENPENYVFDNISSLKKGYTGIISTGDIDGEANIVLRTNRRCYLYMVKPKADIEEPEYVWEQIAKLENIDEKIKDYNEATCPGDVQIFNWANDKDLPLIDDGSVPEVMKRNKCAVDKPCENRYRQVLRWNGSLYVVSDTEQGLTLDMRKLSKKHFDCKKDNQKIGASYFSRLVRAQLGMDDYDIMADNNAIFPTKYVDCTNLYTDYSEGWNRDDALNGVFHGLRIGTGGAYGNLSIYMRNNVKFNSVTVELESYSNDGEYTTDDGNVNITVGGREGKETKNVWFPQGSYEGTHMDWVPLRGWQFLAVNKDTTRTGFIQFNITGGGVSEFPLGVGTQFRIPGFDYTMTFDSMQNMYDAVGNIFIYGTCYINGFDGTYPAFATEGASRTSILTYQEVEVYTPNPIQRETVTLSVNNATSLVIETTQREETGTGRRAVIRSITFSNFTYENRGTGEIIDFYCKEYWKQMSGGASSSNNSNGKGLLTVVFGRTIKEHSIPGTKYYFADGRIKLIRRGDDVGMGYDEINYGRPCIFTIPENFDFNRMKNDLEYVKANTTNASKLNAETTSPHFIIRDGEFVCVKRDINSDVRVRYYRGNASKTRKGGRFSTTVPTKFNKCTNYKSREISVIPISSRRVSSLSIHQYKFRQKRLLFGNLHYEVEYRNEYDELLCRYSCTYIPDKEYEQEHGKYQFFVNKFMEFSDIYNEDPERLYKRNIVLCDTRTTELGQYIMTDTDGNYRGTVCDITGDYNPDEDNNKDWVYYPVNIDIKKAGSEHSCSGV